jgi:hypothetical protein
MSILDELSSSLGTRTQEANGAVADRCLAHPELLGDIVRGLGEKNHQRAADCAEVMTKVAEKAPALVAPHAPVLIDLLDHKNGRVRWESAHALGLVAALVPAIVEKDLERLGGIIREGDGVIVRDYVIDAVAGYGSSSAKAAARAFPILRDAAPSFDGKHAARVLAAMPRLVAQKPSLAADARDLASRFLDHPKSGARKAAKALAKGMAKL